MARNYSVSLLLATLFMFYASIVAGLGQKKTISFEKVKNGVTLHGADLLVDARDWPGVIRAVNDLSEDFKRVTGKALKVTKANTKTKRDIEPRAGGNHAIIVGTLGESPLIEEIIKAKKIDVSKIKGEWEAFKTVVVDNPTKGVDKALVIIGSDKRGSIYGIYDVSEQIGVSPWYWWADVPTDRQNQIYAQNVERVQGAPSVKYRGIFINDEQPALTNWNLEKFDTLFDSEFYKYVFELILRLRGNFLWPAMWNSMFGVDDPKNQFTADLYGVVMSTSHTEPLSRATKEWSVFGKGDWDYTQNSDNIKEFFKDGVNRTAPFEHVWTMGMRGYHDTSLSATVATELLEGIIKDQTEILKDILKEDDLSEVPRAWCLYKDVQSYYEAGMRVPDDITLLWTDDNWGNIRRLPTGNETARIGGAGVYYHFDYVGDPRDYKWINTIQNEKTWEQMHMAYQKQARNIWVVNVGSIKPKENPIDYFLSLAYDFDTWGKPNKVADWTYEWAKLNFGAKYAKEAADISTRYGKATSRRKFELVDPNTYNVIEYREADRILAEWKQLAEDAAALYKKVPKEYKAAVFELLYHPANAGYIVIDIHINSARNNLFANQRRNSANERAEYVRKRFNDDHNLAQEYHTLLGGKWNHFMSQTHLGYNYWQQPMRNTLPPLMYTQTLENSLAGSLGLTVESSNGSIPGDDPMNVVGYGNDTLVLPVLEPYGEKTRWIDLFSKGTQDLTWTLIPRNPWVKVSKTTGRFRRGSTEDVRVEVSIDWSKAPSGYHINVIDVNSTSDWGNFGRPSVSVLTNKTSVPTDFHGFVESRKTLAFDGPNFTRNSTGSEKSVYYQTLKNYSKTSSSVTIFPVDTKARLTPANAPKLEYDVYVFNPNDKANITAYLSPSLNFDPDRPLRYAVGINNDEPVENLYVPLAKPLDMPAGWGQAVSDAAWKKTTMHKLPTGKNTIKFWALEPGVVLHRLVVDLGGVRKSYLGPPESQKV